jgi:ribosome biogenesis GTPase A
LSDVAIQWYPGHIAKAERSLSASLQKVDLVLEVRDARIPLATGHPRLERWTKDKARLLVLNRRDMVSEQSRLGWDRWFRARGETPWWCDAKAGTGVMQLMQAAVRAGESLNERRRLRGMKPRPVRALMLGFPNVGKSALINRLVRQKVVNSARRAGVTRTLRWVRLGQALDLLDAPGVLPPRLENKQAALLLAYCDDIGQAAYNVEAVALAFLQLLSSLEGLPLAGVPKGLLEQRYGIPLAPLAPAAIDLAKDVLAADFEVCTGRTEAENLGEEPASDPYTDPNSDLDTDPNTDLNTNPESNPHAALNAHPDLGTWLERAAARHTGGDTTRMASKLLDDFRRSALGPITLELPPADG